MIFHPQIAVSLRSSVSILLMIFLTSVSSYGAVVASIDWDNSDTTADGVITGMLGGSTVTVTTGTGKSGTSPTSPENGGVFLGTGTNWASNLGSNDAPGISDPGIFDEAAVIDMGLASEGRTVISFSQPVTNPTVLINFVHDNFIAFYFDPFMPQLVLVDQGVVSPVFLGNTVNINAAEGNNTADSGFAVRFTGTFNEIGFDTSPGVNGLDQQTVALTVVATIPEPSSTMLLLSASVALMAIRRRS